MNERLLQIIIFIGIPVVTSGLFHTCMKRYLIASVLAAFISTILFPLLSYIEMGYFDPLLLLGLFTTFIVCSGVSLIVGLPFLIARRNKGENCRPVEK